MSLDVFIHGPGFGEAVILRWQGPTGPLAGLIDCLGQDEGGWMATRLSELGITHLEFLVATHPHLDHVGGMASAMRRIGWAVDHFRWWGGLAPQTLVEYYDRLKEQTGSELRGTAAAASDLLVESRIAETKNHRPRIREIGRVAQVYDQEVSSGVTLRVRSLGPWGRPLLRYTRQVAAGILPGGNVVYRDSHANLVSVGLLVSYGEAQVILGADVEAANWRALRQSKECPLLRPSLIKVSHHGSRTGRIQNMWTPAGFFGQRGPTSLAVVTPWRPQFARNGRRSLPDSEVIEEIRRAGYAVYQTGELLPGSMGRQLDSHLHIRVEADGTAQVVGQSCVKMYPPHSP